MPEAMERDLKARAKKKGYKPGSKAYNAYVYGTMQQRGLLGNTSSGKAHTLGGSK